MNRIVARSFVREYWRRSGLGFLVYSEALDWGWGEKSIIGWTTGSISVSYWGLFWPVFSGSVANNAHTGIGEHALIAENVQVAETATLNAMGGNPNTAAPRREAFVGPPPPITSLTDARHALFRQIRYKNIPILSRLIEIDDAITAPIVGIFTGMPVGWFSGMTPTQEATNTANAIMLMGSLTPAGVVRSIAARGTALASGAGGEVLPMTIVRTLPPGTAGGVVNEARALTFATGNEHAVVRLATGDRALVSGGPGGIAFGEGQVTRIIGHTHPYGFGSIGPSAADAAALRALGQTHSYVLDGAGNIIRFGPK